MTPEQFYQLLDLGTFSLITSLGMFAFIAGHAAGSTISSVRKITHIAT